MIPFRNSFDSKFSEKSIALIIDHNGGGGANKYSNELINDFNSSSVASIKMFEYYNLFILKVSNKYDNKYYFSESLFEVFSKLRRINVNQVIVNSFYGFSDIKNIQTNLIDFKNIKRPKMTYLVHDYHMLCPSPHLMNYEDEFCNIPSNQVCKNCLKKNIGWHHPWISDEDKVSDISLWRRDFKIFLNHCDDIKIFDESSREIISKKYSSILKKIECIPHDIKKLKKIKKNNRYDLKKNNKLMQIAFVGTLSKVKGYDKIIKLNSYILKNKLDAQINVIGESTDQLPPSINYYGRYDSDNLLNNIKELGINIFILPSIVPETFSYVLSEIMQSELPILTFDIGAQGRRLKKYKWGLIVPLESTGKEIYKGLEALYRNYVRDKN